MLDAVLAPQELLATTLMFPVENPEPIVTGNVKLVVVIGDVPRLEVIPEGNVHL